MNEETNSCIPWFDFRWLWAVRQRCGVVTMLLVLRFSAKPRASLNCSLLHRNGAVIGCHCWCGYLDACAVRFATFCLVRLASIDAHRTDKWRPTKQRRQAIWRRSGNLQNENRSKAPISNAIHSFSFSRATRQNGRNVHRIKETLRHRQTWGEATLFRGTAAGLV